MRKSKCSRCPFWRWMKADRLYGTPGFHLCGNPNKYKNCLHYGCGIKPVERNEAGFITDKCLKDMQDSLPIDVYVNQQTPHRTIKDKQELEAYLFGALPYALTTHYRKNYESDNKRH